MAMGAISVAILRQTSHRSTLLDASSCENVSIRVSNPTYAIGECDQIPEGAWWGKTSHEKISSYVERKHNGDWHPYMKKWERQLKSMRKIEARDGTAVFKKKGLVLSGAKLSEYVEALEVRVTVNACLSDSGMTEQVAREVTDTGNN
ncbi:MAG: hypothetical protein HN360_05920 [Rhodospirillaceae bacterium]|jgi:hypothetical protein|nr:hypothetical protein [Rhodospirillaceae bacterium]MBT4218442.1 hypothetical protein [Rhodospirillaceae bacterium]MBT7356204.1 hypothetical protein [Rhodospirillaceae bacterium]